MTPVWVDTIRFGVSLFFMLIGLFGLIVPLYPGAVIMWITALVYGLVRGFDLLGGVMFAFITLMMITAVVADNILTSAGARWGGASWKAVGLAIVAGIAGTIFMPPFGGLLTTPLAILLYEYWRMRDWNKAFNALKGLALGYGTAYFVRLGLGFGILILWLVWAWKG
jgi:hypothetical protein